MSCPHLKTLTFSLCLIKGRTYAPSAIEFHDYCRGKGHTRCPLFRNTVHAARKAGDKR